MNFEPNSSFRGASYYPEAFEQEWLILGEKVAADPTFYREFVHYLSLTISDLTQIVHGRARVIESALNTITKHGPQTVSLNKTTWSALTFASEKYFQEQARKHNWTLSEHDRVCNAWFKVLAPVFTPSETVLRLDVPSLKAWRECYLELCELNF